MENKDKFYVKALFFILGVLIVVFVLYHTFNSLFNPYVTEVAYETTVKKSISADCYIVRKEKIISSDNDGYKVFKVSNGGKIAKNSTVVSFYENEKDVELANEINEREEFLASIEEIEMQNAIQTAELDIISEQIGDNVYSMLENVNANNFSEVQKNLKSIRYFMAQRQLATGREESYESVIKESKAELDKLKSQYVSTVKEIKSDYSGYFVNLTDGYENSLDYDNIDDLTVSQFNNIKAGETDKSQVGKVIIENEWYIVTVVDTTSLKGISKGDNLTINTSLVSADNLSVTVSAINKSDDGKKSVLVLSCMEMNEELATLRHKNMQIVLDQYKGLKVNSKAVRIKDGKKGVFVRLGSITRFVETDIIYNTSDYVIVDTNYSANELKIYDDVVVKGRVLDE